MPTYYRVITIAKWPMYNFPGFEEGLTQLGLWVLESKEGLLLEKLRNFVEVVSAHWEQAVKRLFGGDRNIHL